MTECILSLDVILLLNIFSYVTGSTNSCSILHYFICVYIWLQSC